MDFNNSAQAIILIVGGAKNINSLIHCSTRLRFTLHDFAKPIKKNSHLCYCEVTTTNTLTARRVSNAIVHKTRLNSNTKVQVMVTN